MEVEEKFVMVAGIMCEPTRARMLWHLLDRRAYTASELSVVAGISATSTSNHLSKLLEADIVKVEMQGRHRYYSISSPEVAYVTEALANLASDKSSDKLQRAPVQSGIKYCRTCYDHLAGFVGVSVTEAMEKKGYLRKTETAYMITEKGWKWFAQFDILKENFTNTRRHLTRQCLDWSERRPHLAGQLGALFLEKMMGRKWFRKINFSRELMVVPKGRKEAYDLLGITLQ